MYKDDVLYDNQLIINPILVRRFTPSSMWIKNLFSRRSAAVVVREIQDECIFIVYDFCNPPPLLSILFPYVRNFSFFMPRSIQLLALKFYIRNLFWSTTYWQKHQIVYMPRYKSTFALEFWTKNRPFLRPQLSLKSKTNTNQQQISCLVYPIKWTVPLIFPKKWKKIRL